jgi:hypothetical protein
LVKYLFEKYQWRKVVDGKSATLFGIAYYLLLGGRTFALPISESLERKSKASGGTFFSAVKNMHQAQQTQLFKLISPHFSYKFSN